MLSSCGALTEVHIFRLPFSSFIDSVTLAVNAPVLKYVALTLTDLDGAEMDRLMQGQSSYLTFDIENQGHSKSLEISNKFNLLAPFLNVAESEIDIPGIDAGGSARVTFIVNVDDDAADGILNYSLQAESGHYTDLLESQIPLGYTIEDFEGETLNANLQWKLGSGNKQWTIVADTTAHGGHCLRSPVLNNNGVSTVNIGITTEVEDKFSFLHKTSTEEGDILQFWMNGKEVETWSGISDWEKAEVDLPAGTNLIRFTFKKNTEGCDGEDAVIRTKPSRPKATSTTTANLHGRLTATALSMTPLWSTRPIPLARLTSLEVKWPSRLQAFPLWTAASKAA